MKEKMFSVQSLKKKAEQKLQNNFQSLGLIYMTEFSNYEKLEFYILLYW